MLVLSLKVISWVSQTFQRRCWLFSLVVNTSMEIRFVNSRQQSNYNLELNQLYKILLDQYKTTIGYNKHDYNKDDYNKDEYNKDDYNKDDYNKDD